ncbi:protein of unknown function [Polaromonas sp. OV174]|uniref:DUF4124 domain-containing protein n=1 Tax=Polaromonas sp. OV174 TaxID=1855300 RepID=UPI0008E835B9|nr:DUF4124 domain-containing protein [Polaromonas sp. OV174]SFB86972.1 protein of unknown function [Polaromonas sp. OV174]
MLAPTMRTLGLLCTAWLCGSAAAQGIYTCVDGKGRKITADRPIIECIDRTQQELTRTGTIKRELGPSLTAPERAAQEEKNRRAAELLAREAEEKRRDRALLLRYPNRAVHDQERSTALAQIDEVIKASSKRTGELAAQRQAIASEFEFYAKDPAKAPTSLKLRLEDNESSVDVQQKFIADQQREKKRVNQRFDEELVKLKELWTLRGGTPAGASTAKN